MERAFHICIMWQPEVGQQTYADAVVTTGFSPFNEKFHEYIKKAVCEKRNAPIEKTVVMSLSRVD